MNVSILVKETVALLETSSDSYLKKNLDFQSKTGANNPHPYLLTSKAYISQ